MPLPTGAISFSQINTELRRTSTAQLSMSDGDFRGLAGQESGQVDMLNCRGKSIVGRGTGSNVATSVIGSGFSAASAAIWFGGNGVHQTVANGTFTNRANIGGRPHRWTMLFDSSSNLGTEYQIRATQTGSSGSGGTLVFGGASGSWSNNTWTTIGTGSRSVTLSVSGGNTAGRVFTISIRELSGSTVVGTSTNIEIDAVTFQF